MRTFFLFAGLLFLQHNSLHATECGGSDGALATERPDESSIPTGQLLRDEGSLPTGQIPPREQIDSFSLISKLGSGAYGDVWLAERDGKQSIVKSLRDFRALEALKNEAMMAIRLGSPELARANHINPIEEADFESSPPHLVLEYIEGESLRDRLKRVERMPYDQASLVIQQLLIALQFAHARGVVHLDLKPENILITSKDEIFVYDFGLAKDTNKPMVSISMSEMTTGGIVQGSYYYMAPEQEKGLLAKVGPKSDLYALGVIFYELLTGDRRARRWETENERDSLIYAQLERLLARALVQDPDKRIGSAYAFSYDLALVRTTKYELIQLLNREEIDVVRRVSKIFTDGKIKVEQDDIHLLEDLVKDVGLLGRRNITSPEREKLVLKAIATNRSTDATTCLVSFICRFFPGDTAFANELLAGRELTEGHYMFLKIIKGDKKPHAQMANHMLKTRGKK